MTIRTPLATGWTVAPSKRLTYEDEIVTYPAQVPGHVHLDLIKNGIIPHPFYRNYELAAQWVDTTEWIYETTFAHSPKDSHPITKLHFEGLDTICEVFLNNNKIAAHENMFVPLTVDISNVVQQGENTLKIHFKSNVTEGYNRLYAFLDKHGLPRTTARLEERSFVRKAQYMYGWDWGPRLASAGIWKPCYILQESTEPKIKDVSTTQDHKEGNITLHITTTLTAPLTTQQIEAYVFDEDEAFTVNFEKVDETTYQASTDVSHLDLWSTDHPILYSLNVAIVGSNSELIDETNLNIGLRTIELKKERDEFGETFTFELNGQEIFAVGANWIPDHSFPSTITREQLRIKLEAAKEMGMNMLRVWGGGLYESDDFYDLCDELGILVWQDFPFGCAYYPDDAEYLPIYRAEAEHNIKRLRNHPSLAIWCGNNENYQMFDQKWGGAENTPDRFFGQAIYEGPLEEATKELDPNRPYIRSSAYGKDPSLVQAPDNYDHNMGRIGDSHYWDVWHGRGDWKYYSDSTTRFSSEFGFASAPSIEVFEEFIDASQWEPFSNELNWHNKTRKPVQVFAEMVELHYPFIQTVEDLTYYTQLNQRDAMRFGIEHWRRSGFCMGTLIWQLNDCWPVQSWALMDCFGHFKAAAHELRRLYSPLLISLVKQDSAVETHAILHNDDDAGIATTIQAINLQTGEVLKTQDFPGISLTRNQIVPLGTLDTSDLDPTTTLIVVLDSDDQEELLAWTLLAEPKDVEFPPTPITISTSDDGIITLQTHGPVVDLYLTEPENGTQFGLNFITSPIPSTYIIEVDGPIEEVTARSLAGYHP